MYRFVIVLLLVIQAPAAAAAQTVYECRAQQRNYASEFWSPFRNLIQPQMRFTVDGGSVVVDDPLLRSAKGGPIQGELVENTEKKLVVRWDLVARGERGRQATMLFRASFLKQNSKLIVTQAVSGSGTTFHARGNCIALSGTG